MVCIYERRYFLHAKYPPDSRWDARKKEVFLSFRLNVTFCLFPVARCRFANPVAASFAQDNFAVDKRQKRVFKEQAEWNKKGRRIWKARAINSGILFLLLENPQRDA